MFKKKKAAEAEKEKPGKEEGGMKKRSASEIRNAMYGKKEVKDVKK